MLARLRVANYRYPLLSFFPGCHAVRETWNWSMELRSGGGQQQGQPWWRVCLVHGDQHKFYRQLYGHKRAAIRTHIR